MGIYIAVRPSLTVSGSPYRHALFLSRYEKRKRRDGSHTVAYHFVGYSSLYPFYHFPEKVRMRLR